MDKQNSNGNGIDKNVVELAAQWENRRLKQLLKKAVLQENAPESLRRSISKMIRQ